MAQTKQKCRTQTRDQVYIPPLNLPSSPINSCKSKQILAFFKTPPLDQNADFLKQKTLYRYTISRKLNRNQITKSQAYLHTGSVRQHSKSRQVRQSNSGEIKGQTEEISYQSGNAENQELKYRHFKRKNFHSKISSQLNESNQLSVDHKVTFQNEQDYSKINNKLKSGNISLDQKRQNQIDQAAIIKQLQKDVTNSNQQNRKLNEIIKQKDKQLQNMRQDIKGLKRQIERLLLEVKRNNIIHNQNFINDHKLENQLILRDNLIQKLQTNIKYIELENLTLKKLKSQYAKQTNMIRLLQKENKMLEQKIRLLYRQRTKRSRMKTSLISQWSDLSLNLSLDQEEADKILQVLKTAERTPQKIKISSRNLSTLQKGQRVQLLCPLRRSRKEK